MKQQLFWLVLMFGALQVNASPIQNRDDGSAYRAVFRALSSVAQTVLSNRNSVIFCQVTNCIDCIDQVGLSNMFVRVRTCAKPQDAYQRSLFHEDQGDFFVCFWGEMSEPENLWMLREYALYVGGLETVRLCETTGIMDSTEYSFGGKRMTSVLSHEQIKERNDLAQCAASVLLERESAVCYLRDTVKNLYRKGKISGKQIAVLSQLSGVKLLDDFAE